MAESALVILVPEAEALVAPFRARFDPAAAVGVPAHITLLYPFKPPAEIDAAVLDGLRRCVAGFAPFRFALTEARRFPGVLYLAPEPAAPFVALTRAIWRLHPETPPYGGRHPDIVPHLSIAQIADEAELDRVAADFAVACEHTRPVSSMAQAVVMLESREGRWHMRERLNLGVPL